MAERDPYQVLGVPRKASPDEIKKAYRRLAKKHHPDRNRNDTNAAARFKEIQSAYEILNDSEKRADYDRYGHVGAGDPFGGAPGTSRTGRTHSWSTRSGSEIPIENIEDLFSVFSGQRGATRSAAGASIFDEFLGQARGPKRRSSPRQPHAEPAGARDVEHEISLTFDQALHGTTLDLARTEAGRSNRSSTLSVKIPPGVVDGQRIRLRGKGQPARRGASPGDLYIVCRVQPHAWFRREGNDIFLELPLSVSEATLGAKVEIPTIDGFTVVTVPPATPSGAKLRLKGKGVRGRGSKGRGDQYVVVQIVPPKALTDRQRELLETFRETEESSPRDNVAWRRPE